MSLGPDIDFVFHNRAKLRLWLHRDFDGCREDAERILQVNPTYQFAVEDRACVDIFAGRREDGLSALEGLVEKVPRDPINSFRRSIIAIGHSLQGNVDKAIVFARSAFEQKPFVPIHLIAYSVAASPELVKSPRFPEATGRQPCHAARR